MSQELLLECSFFIPLRRDVNLSDGMPHLSDAWAWLDDELFANFGGRTIAPDEYDGFYRDPDTQERVFDKSRKFLVAIAPTQRAELRSLLAATCVIFGQKCIYLSIAGEVEFVTYELP